MIALNESISLGAREILCMRGFSDEVVGGREIRNDRVSDRELH